MRYLISSLLIALLSLGLMINDASAKRFGGGRSFGVQRSHSSLFSSNKAQNTATLGRNVNKNRWGGLLGGLLVGGLLTSLLMGNGLGSGLLTWLLLGAAAYFIINMMRKKSMPAMQSASTHTPWQHAANPFKQQYAASAAQGSGQTTGATNEAFLRNAKICFIRLQAAYDKKDLNDLQTFTLPEIYAEIKMQLDERADEPNITEVIHLSAELLDMSKQSDSTLATVRFTGSIKENNEAVSPLDELWHFRQFTHNSQWVVAGIQQEVYQP